MTIIGQVDQISRAHVVGWAVDTDRPSSHLAVRIMVDGVEAGICRADRMREQLSLQIGPRAGDDHGFSFAFEPALPVYRPAHVTVEIVGHPGLPLDGASRVLPAPEPPGMLSPVIVTSTGRSGTTLLMSELARHPRIVVANRHPFEIKLVAYYASAFRALTANEDREHSTHPDRMFVDDDLYRIGHNPYNTPGTYELTSRHEAMADLFERTIPERYAEMFRRNILDFYTILQRGQSKRQATLFAEKGDLNPAARAGCRMLFGRVREVILVRDPRDLLCSAKAFWNMDTASAIAMLDTTLPQLTDIATQADPDTLILRYEDIITDPERVRGRLFGFLGLDPLDILTQAGRLQAGRHGTTATALASLARWQTDLAEAEQTACTAHFATYAQTFGYTMEATVEESVTTLCFNPDAVVDSSDAGTPRRDGLSMIDIPVGSELMPRMMLDGWSAIEGDHVWSCKGQAVLRLCLPPSTAALAVTLGVKPFTVPGRLPLQRVGVTVDGRHIGWVSVGSRGVLTFDLAGEAVQGDRLIHFDFPDAGRPAEHDLSSTDDRLLGLDLNRVVVTVVRRSGRGGATNEASLVKLMRGFESLGENCEFGLAQQRCGVEPSGLLGFGSAPFPKLLQALRSRFAGVGAPENTTVAVSDSGSEYMVYDLQFGLNYHTWIERGASAPEAIRTRELGRLPSLVSSLLAELDAGQKIFVYRSVQSMEADDAVALAAEIQAYGPGTLLWIEANPIQQTPIVTWAGPRLMRGVVRRLAPPDDATNFYLGDWITLCRQAATLRASQNV